MEPLAPILYNALGTVLGSKFSSALSRGRKKTDERIREWAKDFSKRLHNLECKIDPEILSDTVTHIAWSLTKDSRDDKLKTFRSILDDAYCASLDEAHTRLFVSLTDRFDVYHLHVIRALRKPLVHDNDESDIAEASFGSLTEKLKESSGRSGPEMSDITTLVISDLVNAGLISTSPRPESRGKPLVNTNTLGLLRMQVYSLTSLGTLYSKHVLSTSTTETSPKL